MSVPVTKSEAVRELIVSDIRRGKLTRGERLPGENSLAHRFDVSRATVRLALADLQRGGYIATQAGSGSFVTYDGRDIAPTESWSGTLAAQGITFTTRILRFETSHEPDLAADLNLTDDTFLAVDRVRSSNGEAISLEKSRLPHRAMFDDLTAERLLDGSLTATLERLGLVTDQMEEWATIETLKPDAAQALARPVGEPWLHLRSLARDERGDVVEHIESDLDPTHFHLHHIYRKAHHV